MIRAGSSAWTYGFPRWSSRAKLSAPRVGTPGRGKRRSAVAWWSETPWCSTTAMPNIATEGWRIGRHPEIRRLHSAAPIEPQGHRRRAFLGQSGAQGAGEIRALDLQLG